MSSGRFVRTSKFRHVFGTAYKKDQCYDQLKISKSDSGNLIKVNGKYISVPWESSGGGAFAVIPMAQVGKLPVDYPGVINGAHTGAVLDTDFSPFNMDLVASASEDAKIMVWNLVSLEDVLSYGYCETWNKPVVTLLGHGRKVTSILFHPTAENVLASTSSDLTIRLWDIEKGLEKVCMKNVHDDMVHSLAWNYNGSLLASISKDKRIKILDPRQNAIIHECTAHQGVKGSFVTWLGNTNQILTTGFSRSSDRQVSIWDLSKLDAGAVKTENLDTSSGSLIPYYDQDTKMLYLSGKGDGNIRFFEVTNEEPYIHVLSEYKSNEPQRGIAFLAKRFLNIAENEIARAYKLTSTAIEPISFKVPRKSDVFQPDLYPDTTGPVASLTLSQFFEGQTADPILVSLDASSASPHHQKRHFKADIEERSFASLLTATPKSEQVGIAEGNSPSGLKELVEKLSAENNSLKANVATRDHRIKELETQLASLSASST